MPTSLSNIKDFIKKEDQIDLYDSIISFELRNINVKLRIRDSTIRDFEIDDFDINFYRNDTHCFLFSIGVAGNDYIKSLIEWIKEVRKKYQKNIPIFVLITEWEERSRFQIKYQFSNSNIKLLENKLNCKVLKSNADKEYINEVWKTIANECFKNSPNIKKHKNKKKCKLKK